WLTRGKAKWFVLVYFMLNLFVFTMSTSMVVTGRRAPIEKVRFLLAFQLPWNMPQLLNFGHFPDWAVHLSFRMYSMMLTTTVLGLLLAWIFKPRTWCTICPINTVSDLALRKGKKSKSSSNLGI
ncbi:MAG: 4Fe-4S binding protein, partial [Gorillibacterium sp.]|nr:4Fe-4S binding protein [Gorillibacterium sp.]